MLGTTVVYGKCYHICTKTMIWEGEGELDFIGNKLKYSRFILLTDTHEINENLINYPKIDNESTVFYSKANGQRQDNVY